MDYIIGVDSGGTSTKTAAYDLKGNLIQATETGFGNLLNNQTQGLANIRKSLDNIFAELKEDLCELIVLGVAGVDSGDFKETIIRELSHYHPKVVVLNDAWMAHYALLGGANGCLIISGTGSIVIGKNQDKNDRVGGWGNLLGDEGSGYDIARKLVKIVLDTYDTDVAYSPLAKKLMQDGGFATPFEIVKFVYSSSKDQIAQLSMIAVEAAEEGDQEAIKLFTEAGVDLANQTKLLLNKLSLPNQAKVAVTGSVLLKNDWVFEAFKRELLEKYPKTEIIRKDISNTIGGYYFYKSTLE